MRSVTIVLAFTLSLVALSACKPENKKDSPPQESYTIQMGDAAFNIPVDYLVDSRNRIDASEVKKIKVPSNNRDGRYEPHRYVILMALLPDLINFKNGRDFSRAPDRTLETIQFNMSYNKGGAYNGIGNLIESADENSTVTVPNFKNTRDGLVKIGHSEPSQRYEDFYVYIKSGIPVSFLWCVPKPTAVNPACTGYLAYDDSISLNLHFSIENIEWYGSQGGLDKIIALIDSWHIKNTPSTTPEQVK